MLKNEISLHFLIFCLFVYWISIMSKNLKKFWENLIPSLLNLIPSLFFMRSIIEFIFSTLYMTIFQLLFLIFLPLDFIDNKKWDILIVGSTIVFVFLYALIVLIDLLYNKFHFNKICLKGLLYQSWTISLLGCDLI